MLKILLVILAIIFLVILLNKKIFFAFIPKKSREIYDYVFAHRGFHFVAPENSISSYLPMLDKFAIEIDVRFLKKDNTIICFHDRYTSRLLNVPGKTSSYTYKELREFTYTGSKEKVTKLSKALKVIAGRSVLLIETKGYLTDAYQKELIRVLKDYKGTVYFHCGNILTYFKLSKIYPNRVFWVFNIFRKRFNFLKGSHYKNTFERFLSLFDDASIEIPSIYDISQVLVDKFEDNKSVREICATISGFLNNYQTRVDDNHWITNSLILHRGIVSSKFPEHSKEAFEECVKYAVKNNMRVAIEFDLILHEGKVICYHSDKISDKLGQEKSSAEKMDIANAPTLQDIISIVKGNEKLVSLVLDIKDFHARNRSLEKEIIKILDETNYTGNFSVQSWNPFVLMFFEKNKPEYIRGQIGHSLSGLIKYVPLNGLPWIANFLLFNKSHADYCVYDASNFLYMLLKYNKDIKGRPVFIYAPKSEKEIKSFIGREQISGFIIENPTDKKAWSRAYLKKFKEKDI